MLLIQATAGGISQETMVSVALLIVMIGASWSLSARLKGIEKELEKHTDTPKKLGEIERAISGMQTRMDNLEDDVNNLWAFARAEDPAQLFKVMRSGPRSRKRPEET